MPYYPPTDNWVGYGINILGQYDGGNNDWIQINGNQKEWAVAYQGTSTKDVKPTRKKGGKFFIIIF